MLRHLGASCAFAALICLSQGVCAQQPAPAAAPAPTAAPAPPPPDYGAPITHEQALAAMAAAVAEAKKMNTKMSFSIVGPAGDLVALQKMDGTSNATPDVSQAKARTAVLYRRPSKTFADALAAGNHAFMTFPHVITSNGGVPIVMGGKIIGAIGGSGGTGDQDGQAAAAGAAAVR